MQPFDADKIKKKLRNGETSLRLVCNFIFMKSDCDVSKMCKRIIMKTRLEVTDMHFLQNSYLLFVIISSESANNPH